MIRIIGTSVLVLLSVAIVVASWEIKAWSQLDLNIITSNIFEISVASVPAGELPNLLGKFENLRYAQLHKLDIVASQADQIFNILAVVTLN